MDIIAIDPGKTGAVAVGRESRLETMPGFRWRVFDCPTVVIKSGKTKKAVCDPTLMAALLRDLVDPGRATHVIIERVHAMPKQGVSSSFNFGMGYGVWQGIVAAMQLPVTYVTPQAWTKVLLQGQAKGDKQAGRLRALQLFPYLAEELKLKKHDGRGDALCIGAYGKGVLDNG